MNYKEIEDLIIEEAFYKKEKSTELNYTFISGQTGSGKSTYIKNNTEKNTITITPDEYLQKIPIKLGSMEEKLEFITNISNKIEKIALENKNNIIVESTIFHPEYYFKEIENIKKNGYEVNFLMIGTNKEISSCQMLNRNEEHYHEALENNVQPRIGSLEMHDQLSYFLKNLIRELEESSKFDSIKIIRSADEKELYNSNNNTQNTTGEEVFEKELNRPLKIQEIEKIKLLEKNILSSMEQRNDPKLEMIKNFFEINKKTRKISSTTKLIRNITKNKNLKGNER